MPDTDATIEVPAENLTIGDTIVKTREFHGEPLTTRFTITADDGTRDIAGKTYRHFRGDNSGDKIVSTSNHGLLVDITDTVTITR